jgi:peptidyl-prolyl cis-trans isomerase B (cyclophilin B)
LTVYQPQPYAPTRPTNVLAVVSLVLSIVGIHVGGIICGHIALSQIRRTGEGGRALALAGVIVGYVGLGVVLLSVIFFVFVLGVLGLGTWGVASLTPGF